MLDDRDQCWVARFRSHPMGEGRYVRDFTRYWYGNSMFREQNTEEVVRGDIAFWLTHEQYHLSTDDLQKADLVTGTNRELYEKWLDVEMVPVNLTTVPAGETDA